MQYTWNEISKDSMEVDVLKKMKWSLPEKNATRQCIFFNVASYMDSLDTRTSLNLQFNTSKEYSYCYVVVLLLLSLS